MAAITAIAIGSMAAYSPVKNDPGPWKNLKVLPQDISRDSLHNLMDGYNAALGVKCNFCHSPKANGERGLDFPSDDKKEKGFARHMITMTREINSKNFNWNHAANPDTINVVTCGTCHRGHAEVEPFIAPPREERPH